MSITHTQKFLTALKKHLTDTKQAFCFDESGRIWSRDEVVRSLKAVKTYQY